MKPEPFFSRSLAAIRAAAESPWLALAFRLYIGGLFIYASMYKINYPAEFAESIASYQIVPYFLINFLAVVLPWIELVCGSLMVAGIRPRFAALMLFALLSVFTVAIAVTLVRGVPIGCGCFHSIEDQISIATLFRDLAWMAMTCHVYRYDSLFHLEKHFLMRIEGL
jgi:putative oxidoreductase